MIDLIPFKNEVASIVNNLAKAVVAQVLTATEEVSLTKPNPETREKLGALVDSLCVEAVEKILEMVELAPLIQEEPPGDRTPRTCLPRSDGTSEGSLRTWPGTEEWRVPVGEDSGGEPPRTEPTYILVYEASEQIHSNRQRTDVKLPNNPQHCGQSAATDPRCQLVPLQSAADANGETKTISTEVTAEVTTLHSKHSSSSSSSSSSPPPPPQADFPDHEYARTSSPQLGAATAGEGGVSAVRSRKACSRKKRSRKQLSGRWRMDANTPTAETMESHYRCPQCGMLFPNIERLSDHQTKSHPLCSVCGAPFAGILKLREHEIKEHGLLPYTCDYCPKRFNHKAHRNLHIKARHTGEKTCHCDICGKGYSCISVLKTHRMTHFDKTFICDVCGKSFYHACHLTRHKLVHQEVRPYRCSTCGKGFTQAANLRSHQAIHTGERQLCSLCGKSYRRLKNHVISKHAHELSDNELPARDTIITCEVCGKKFPNPSQFRVHQRSHTGEKPFHCDICGKSYRLKELLRDHRYTHTGEKPYRCSLCPKTFNLATSFMRHRSIHTGETPYSCHDCGKHFRLLTFLKAHLQTKAHLKQTQQRPPASSDL